VIKMNDRKLHVIKMAHQLFIEKGYQATSIQDILDYSGISKGTFYNYFSSKSELLIAIYKTVYKKLQQERNEILIGKNPSDIEIFIKQMEMQMITNRKHKLITLYEEVMASNDVDLKQYIQRSRLKSLHWLYGRFIDLFGEDKKPYLLDCAIMFTGLLQHNLQYNRMTFESGEQITHVVRYSVNRLVNLVNDVVKDGDQLHEPEWLEKWLPGCKNDNRKIMEQIHESVSSLKNLFIKNLKDEKDLEKYTELLDFIQEEIIHTRSPRKFLIESALITLKQNSAGLGQKELQMINQKVIDVLSSVEENA
jgi:AcrR family transcriptional regulator